MGVSKPALRIAGAYAVLGTAWAFLSNEILLGFAPDLLVYYQVDVWKEILLALATAFIAYFLLDRQTLAQPSSPHNEQTESGVGSLILVFVALASVIVLLGLGGVAYTALKQKAKEVERLQAISDLKAGQIHSWLEERLANALVLQSDHALLEYHDSWRVDGNAAGRRKLIERLDAFRKTYNYLDVALLDKDGNQILASNPTYQEPPAIQSETALQALRSRRILTTDLYRSDDGKRRQVRLDFLVPLSTTAGRQALVIALSADPDRFLFPFIQSWPVPSASAETLLFRRDGDNVLFLNELRHRRNTSLSLQVPLSNTKLLASQVLLGHAIPGKAVEGVDYRDVPVLGVVRTIPGTSWFLVAKLDKEELYAQTRRDAGWIALAVGLALIAAAAATILLYQRRELHYAQFQKEQQADKLRALQLLEAIAEGSTDAIYAKDRSGRYLLLNRELSRFVGKTKMEILGKDDSVVFPDAADRLMAEDRRVIEFEQVETSEETLPTVGGARTFLVTRGPLHDAEGAVTGLFGVARDITERKFQEREIQASEARFRAIFNGVNDAIFLHDAATGAILEANQKVAEMYGYSKQEARRLSISQLSANEPPYTHREAECRVAEAKRGMTPVFEWLARRSDGSTFWVEISMRRVEIAGRDCILELVRDISERKQAETLMRERLALQEQLAAISATVPLAICSIERKHDGSFRIPYASPAIEALFGFSRGVLAEDAACLLAAIVPEDAGAMRSSLAKSAQSMESWRKEFRYQHPRRGEIWVEGHLAPQRELDGCILWHGFLTDITDRKQGEATLHKLSQAVEQSPVSIMITDPAGGIEYVNRKFSEVSGYSLQELLGRNPRLLKSGETPQEVYRDLWQTITAGGEWAGEFHNRKKNGELFWEFERILPIRDTSGNIASFLAIKEDITERKKTAEEIRRLNETLEHRVAERTIELEYANRELESFSYSISHDLRAPLRIIDGFARMLLNTEQAALSDQGRKYLDRIANSASMLGRLVEDLLDFSMLTRGALVRRRLDMRALAQTIVDDLQDRYPMTRARIEALPEAVCDESMLKLALGNLIDNAFKFSSKSGQPEVVIGSRVDGNEVAYFVKDNGAGFDMRHSDQIFDVFKRMHSHDEYPGTGIGLSIVQRVILRHGGKIWAESTPGEGAIFCFTLGTS